MANDRHILKLNETYQLSLYPLSYNKIYGQENQNEKKTKYIYL